jgi:hypothetical protein
MANLKDISYGVGKYLEVSDASDISDIGTNRTNIDLLNFKLSVNNAYALYNFKDGIIDAYQDATGVDASASTNEIRDSSGKYYSGTVPSVSYNNMTLVSNTQTAAAQPSETRVTVFEHPSTGTTTVNTDIKAYASRDNGTTYTQITLADDGEYESGKKLLSGSADISGQPAGTSMRYKIETLNQSAGKITRLHGVSLQWA